jgi:hypothetical protein
MRFAQMFFAQSYAVQTAFTTCSSIGVARFELATTRSQTERATGLRHTPNISYYMKEGRESQVDCRK